jgi:hypothetical protein
LPHGCDLQQWRKKRCVRAARGKQTGDKIGDGTPEEEKKQKTRIWGEGEANEGGRPFTHEGRTAREVSKWSDLLIAPVPPFPRFLHSTARVCEKRACKRQGASEKDRQWRGEQAATCWGCRQRAVLCKRHSCFSFSLDFPLFDLPLRSRTIIQRHVRGIPSALTHTVATASPLLAGLKGAGKEEKK